MHSFIHFSANEKSFILYVHLLSVKGTAIISHTHKKVVASMASITFSTVSPKNGEAVILTPPPQQEVNPVKTTGYTVLHFYFLLRGLTSCVNW
jgi:hypothetical protein